MKPSALRTVASVFFCGLPILISARQALSADTPAPPAPSPLVTDLTAHYLDGDFDFVESALKEHAKEFQGLPPKQKADVAIISTAVTQSRQPWWKLCKSGKKFPFHPLVWNRRLDADFSPTVNGVQYNNNDGNIHFNIGWDINDMESPAHGEHGFTKGEICELGIWMDMGNADAWSMIPVSSLQDTSEENRNTLIRFEDFRSCVTGAYYGTPRSRRWGLFLCLNNYLPKYEKGNTQMAREAVGAMMIHELLANPAKYPSIKLPTEAPQEHAEAVCAGEIKNWIERHPWTLAEDQSLRDMLKRLAVANCASTFRSASVVLPDKLLEKPADKLSVSFDPEKDKPLAIKRDAWIRAQLRKD
jgi:hypothetical protein